MEILLHNLYSRAQKCNAVLTNFCVYTGQEQFQMMVREDFETAV